MLQYEMDEEPRTFLVITKDGKLEPGPGLSLDKATTEAAEMLAQKFSTRHKTQADRITKLKDALREMIYETTHLSQQEDDGSHWCKISKRTLDKARAAVKGQQDE